MTAEALFDLNSPEIPDSSVVAEHATTPTPVDPDAALVEAVAEAIWDADRLGGMNHGGFGMAQWSSCGDGHQGDYRVMARAAIKTVRSAALGAEVSGA